MKIQLVTKPLSEISTEYIVLPIFEEEKSQFNGVVADFLADNPKFGQLYESQLLYSKNKKFLLLGGGSKQNLNFEKLQNWVGSATKQLVKRTKQATIIVPQVEDLTVEQMGEAIGIGVEIAAFDPTQTHKSDPDKVSLSWLEMVVPRAERGYQDGLKKGLFIAEGINLVRELGDRPANEMTPTYFLNVAKKIAKENKLKITVVDEIQAQKIGMGAFVGVAKGSDEPSFMITLEYKGDSKLKDKWGLVGKGITYDTGGLSIKSSSSMLGMKYDMLGAATVLATIMVAAKLKLRANIVGVISATENGVNGKAQRPGDIVKSYSGKTVEVINTDAEGRLVMMDQLTHAQRLGATKLIDVATLTGAVITALGHVRTGVFGNNPKFTQQLMNAGAEVGEKFWELPMDEEYNELIKSDFADMSNAGSSPSAKSNAGAIFGAKFLEAIIEKDHPWIHLDIAGTGDSTKPKPYRSLGATGATVKTLVKLIKG